MKAWRDVLIRPESTVLSALEVIDASAKQIAIVTAESGRLLGTVTDGDIRRGILRGISLDRPVSEIMNENPTVALQNESRETILGLMQSRSLARIPVVDQTRVVVGLESLTELLQPALRENWVVLMAGGMGRRLYPLTCDCPKPLIKVGNKPILETILEKFISHGFRRFFISVNYKAEMIKAHFGDGARWGVEIRYLEEKMALGTAGALGSLPDQCSDSVIVMNGDILTQINFQQLLDFHGEHGSKATMCVREYDFQIPYGVINLEHHRLVDIEEKPVQRFFVNAGIYALEPEVLSIIKKDRHCDMPALFKQVLSQGLETAAFPVREYWMDVGRLDDLERAKLEYSEVFGQREPRLATGGRACE